MAGSIRDRAFALGKKDPKLWRRVKTGAAIGLVAGGLAAGYKTNYQAARESAKIEARAVDEAKNPDNRSFWQKLTGQGVKPVRKEPRNWDVMKRTPKHMHWTPSFPANKTGIEYGLIGAAGGAALGAGSYFRKKRKIAKQLEGLGEGRDNAHPIQPNQNQGQQAPTRTQPVAPKKITPTKPHTPTGPNTGSSYYKRYGR